MCEIWGIFMKKWYFFLQKQKRTKQIKNKGKF